MKKFGLKRPIRHNCEKCGQILVGKQRRFCSRKCKTSTCGTRKIEDILGNTKCEVSWNEVQMYYDDKHTYKEMRENFGLNTQLITAAKNSGLLKLRTAWETMMLLGKRRGPHSLETRRKMSESKKEFYKKYPEKHNWKSEKKLISPPCEKLKIVN